MENSDDIVQEFLVESHENLDRLDRDLVELEKHPSDREILASIFRTIHTIKGTSGFLGFRNLEAVTHVGESLLARMRDGQLSLTPERTTALLAMVDAVRQMLAEIQATGQDGNADHSQLVAELSGCSRRASNQPRRKRSLRRKRRLLPPSVRRPRNLRQSRRSQRPKRSVAMRNSGSTGASRASRRAGRRWACPGGGAGKHPRGCDAA